MYYTVHVTVYTVCGDEYKEHEYMYTKPYGGTFLIWTPSYVIGQPKSITYHIQENLGEGGEL